MGLRGARRGVRGPQALLVLSLTVLSCCASRPPPETAAEDDSLVLRTVLEGETVGHEVVVRLDAPPAEVEAWLLDFDHIAADRPNVLEAALVRRDGDAWIARFTFRGSLGIDPTAVTRTTRHRDGDVVVLRFRAIETSFGLSDLHGHYRLEPDGPAGTRLEHRLFVGTPFVTEEGRRRDLLEDARAVLARFGAR